MRDQPPGPMPTLITPRLRLRPFTLLDAPEIQRLAGAPEVASTTLRIPHPYPDGIAEAWVLSHRGGYERGEELTLAITRLADGALVGAIGLALSADDARAELGYWIGRPYWGQGYATEAARAVLAHGFDALGLERIHACHFSRNPASGRVLQKVGMTHEGRQRRHALKDGRREDLELYGMLREEFVAGGPPSGTDGRAEAAATAQAPTPTAQAPVARASSAPSASSAATSTASARAAETPNTTSAR